MAPAVAVKLAEVEPEATVTVAGTVNGAALLESVITAPPAGAAFDSVTEQAEVSPGFWLVGEQETWLTTVFAIREIDVFAELPLYEAVTVAD